MRPLRRADEKLTAFVKLESVTSSRRKLVCLSRKSEFREKCPAQNGVSEPALLKASLFGLVPIQGTVPSGFVNLGRFPDEAVIQR